MRKRMLHLWIRAEQRKNEKRFNECMNQQKQTSKASSSFVSSLPAASGVKETKFLG